MISGGSFHSPQAFKGIKNPVWKKKKNEQQKLWLFMSRLRLSLVDEAAQPQANE